MKKVVLTMAAALAVNMAASAKSAVIFFSAERGNTRRIAQQIAELTESHIWEIEPKVPYTAADLDWRDSNSRTTKECHDLANVRPEMAVKLDISEYDTIYLGYPIWWGEAPNILYTFVESTDFSGMTIYPFCTSGGSGIGASAKNLAKNAKGDWKSGRRFSSGATLTEADIKGWK